jgi:large subunit ribosomal protein L33
MAKKGGRLQIRLVSTAGTGTFYVTKKRPQADKMSMRKYDPKTRKHEVFEEKKIS